jgi:hypothetical protein
MNDRGLLDAFIGNPGKRRQGILVHAFQDETDELVGIFLPPEAKTTANRANVFHNDLVAEAKHAALLL